MLNTRIVIILLSIIISIQVLACQTNTKNTSHAYEKGEKHIDSLMNYIMKEHGLVGLAISVNYKNRISYDKAFGYKNLEKKELVKPGSTKFQIASITKLITGLTFLKLIEKGNLKLNDPVHKYIPAFNGELKDKVTLRMLINHTAGIRSYRENERDSTFLSRHYDFALDATEIFMKDDLISKPGAEFNYSSYSFNLLAAVMEIASNKPYEQLVKESVLDPLKLNNTTFDDKRFPNTLRAESYSFYEGRNISSTLNIVPSYYDYSYNKGGGNIVSTTHDMILLGKALLEPGFLSENSYKMFYTSGTTNAGELTNIGYGAFIYPDGEGRKRIYITGAIFGNQASLYVYPGNCLIIAITSNTWGKGENKNEVVEAIPNTIANYILKHKNEFK